jgi:Na+/glutamate symporter
MLNLFAAAAVIDRLHTFGETRMNPIWVATLGVALSALTGAIITAAGIRARNAKQWRTSLDAYAEREIAQHRRKQTVQRAQAFFTLLGTTVVDGPREPSAAKQ